MVHVAGLALAFGLAALVVAAILAIWRAPFRALGILVAGMSVHNFCLMLLLGTGVPQLVVRALQAWKEAVLIVLAIVLVLRIRRTWNEGRWPHLILADYAAIAFAALITTFLMLPIGGGLMQRAFAFRALAMIPLLYLFGRVFWPSARDLRWTLGLIASSACVVVAVGLAELWFVPTSAWVRWGVNLLSAWQGRTYQGPGGLPENFVQATSTGPFLRRMVSTYVSPLGLAYVGLLLVPLAMSLWADRVSGRRWRVLGWASVVLIPAGVVFSVTRLAVVLMVAEFALLALLLPRARTAVAVPIAAAAAALGLFLYPDVGPTIRHDLTPIRQPAGYVLLNGGATAQTTSAVGQPVSASGGVPTRQAAPASPRSSNGSASIVLFPGDTSLQGHLRALQADLAVLAAHPFGTGLGTYAPRFAGTGGLGESAVLGIFDETGVLVGLVYTSLYLLLVLNSWRALRRAAGDWTTRSLPLVALVGGFALIPITLTSDVWSGLVVSFLPWWAAGHCATASAEPTPDQSAGRRSWLETNSAASPP